MNQLLFSELLTVLGHNVHTVGDGAHAIEAVRTEAFDLVLMDVQMPVMDGLTATQALRTLHHATLPIFGLTASTLQEDIERCMAAGMDGHIAKPIDIEALSSIIDQAMENLV